MLVILETLRALAQVMTAAMMDHYTTPDVRDRMTRDAAQGSLREAFDDPFAGHELSGDPPRRSRRAMSHRPATEAGTP